MKTHTKVMVEQVVSTEIKCDLCGKTKHVLASNWTQERFVVQEGCTVSAEEGTIFPDGGSTEIRNADLCFDCANRVLDWIVSQGGNTYTTETDV